MTTFLVIGIALTMFAVAMVVVPMLRNRSGDSSPLTATATALVLPAVIVLLYVTASNFSWDESGAAVAAPDRVPGMAEAIAQLEARLREQPEDREGWLLLGSAYTQTQDFAAAERAYRAAFELGGGNVAKLGLAEAAILRDRSQLAGPAGSLIEDVLAEEPDNARALFYGGMVAGARNDTEVLRARWERLLALAPPPQVREVIEAQLRELGAPVASSAPAGNATDAGIEVRISLADELSDRVDPGAMLFLVAREPGRPGPPIAVVRQSAGDLPITVRISDANAMLPGRSIAQLEQVQLIARIANGGDPIAQPGDISGQRVLAFEAARTATVEIRIDSVVQ